jgi:hypothetical protein
MHRGGRGDARASCASPLGTPLNASDIFSLNASEWISERFYLLRNGSKQNSERFPFCETDGIPTENSKFSVYFVFRGIIFLSATLAVTLHKEKRGCGGLYERHLMSCSLPNIDGIPRCSPVPSSRPYCRSIYVKMNLI